MLNTKTMGYCGVDCSACTDLASGACPGCRQSSWPNGDACPPVTCCQRRNILACGMCDEFPCHMMADFYRESKSHERAGELMQRVHQHRMQQKAPSAQSAAPKS